MPRYQITAPDGREVTIEGERPPTQEDAAKIFAQLPAKRGIPQDTLGAKKKPAPAEVDKERNVGGVLADIALEGGGATAGQLVGAFPALSVPTGGLSIPVGGAIGGLVGNLASQKRRILAGEQKGYRPGEALASFGTGAIPGASLEASGAKAIAREAVKQGAGGIAGRTVETLVDESRLPTGTELAITGAVPALAGGAAQRMQAADPAVQSAVREALASTGATERATLRAGRKEGLKIIPSSVNPGFIENRIEGVAGKAALGQALSKENQDVVDRMAKKSIDLPSNRDITPSSLDEVRKASAKPYEEIREMATTAKRELDDILAKTDSSDVHAVEIARSAPETAENIRRFKTLAAADVDGLRKARADASKNHRAYNSGTGGPEALERAQASDDLADVLQARIDVAADEFGRPGLSAEMKEARKRIAMSWDIENSLNDGNSHISAPALGRALKRGRPLSGELETIAKFQQAFEGVMREGAKVPTAGVSKVEGLAALATAAAGLAKTGSPYGLLAGAIPIIAPPATRAMVLSEPYQRFASRLPLSIDATPPRGAVATRTLAQEAAQELADEAAPSTPEEPKAAAAQVPKPEELPSLTPEQAKAAAPGRFRGSNGLVYEKLPNGTIRRE